MARQEGGSANELFTWLKLNREDAIAQALGLATSRTEVAQFQCMLSKKTSRAKSSRQQ